MPIFIGQVVYTLTDVNGNPSFVVTEFWNSADGTLRDGTTNTSRGSRTGAIVIDNVTGRGQKLQVAGKTLNVSVNGDVFSVAQLATQGLNTISDLAGLLPDVT